MAAPQKKSKKAKRVKGNGGRGMTRGGGTFKGMPCGFGDMKPETPKVPLGRAAAAGRGAGRGGAGGGGNDGWRELFPNVSKVVKRFRRGINDALEISDYWLNAIRESLLEDSETAGHLNQFVMNRFRFVFGADAGGFSARRGLETLHEQTASAFRGARSDIGDLVSKIQNVIDQLTQEDNEVTRDQLDRIYEAHEQMYGRIVHGLLMERIQSTISDARSLIGSLTEDVDRPRQPRIEKPVDKDDESDGLEAEQAEANIMPPLNRKPVLEGLVDPWGPQVLKSKRRNAFILRQGYNTAMGTRFIGVMGFLRARLRMSGFVYMGVNAAFMSLGINNRTYGQWARQDAYFTRAQRQADFDCQVAQLQADQGQAPPDEDKDDN